MWRLAHRADPFARDIADRHYNRQKVGTPQFVPPGRCLVLTASAPSGKALWVTSWPFAEYVKHAWPGAWVCSALAKAHLRVCGDLKIQTRSDLEISDEAGRGDEMSAPKIHADTSERRRTADLIPYVRNSRKHSKESTSALVRGIQEWGWTYPVLIDEDDNVLSGHGRLMAAERLKMDEVPVIVARGWSDEKKRAYVIWDNKSAELSIFDPDILKAELGTLLSDGFDVSLTGFSSLELGNIFSTVEGETDPDEIPDAPTTAVSHAGDLWLFDGGHRIVCGDCTSKEVVDRLYDGRTPSLMVADPPFGVGYSPEWRTTSVPQKGRWKSPNRSHGAVQNDDRADWREAWAQFPGDVAYVWHADKCSSVVEASLTAVGFETRAQIIWSKTQFVIGRGHYHTRHEPCWYMVRKGKNGHWNGDRKQSTIWEIDHKRSETGHGTQKPVEAMARPIRNNSEIGEIVYDPFMGSGTTALAAHMNKRIAFGCELDPIYMDVICARMAKFTGSEPTLAETGETFEAVKARRSEIM